MSRPYLALWLGFLAAAAGSSGAAAAVACQNNYLTSPYEPAFCLPKGADDCGRVGRPGTYCPIGSVCLSGQVGCTDFGAWNHAVVTPLSGRWQIRSRCLGVPYSGWLFLNFTSPATFDGGISSSAGYNGGLQGGRFDGSEISFAVNYVAGWGDVVIEDFAGRYDAATGRIVGTSRPRPPARWSCKTTLFR